MGNFNSNYFITRRGLIRIVMLILGFATTSFLCNTWWGSRSCFNETRLGGVSAANFIFFVVNTVFFVLAILSITNYSFERLVSLAGAIVFGICGVVMIWYIIQNGLQQSVFLLPTALIIVQFCLFVWDWQILDEAHN